MSRFLVGMCCRVPRDRQWLLALAQVQVNVSRETTVSPLALRVILSVITIW
jgi:hypothetical protein